jgi:hypothetical protein
LLHVRSSLLNLSLLKKACNKKLESDVAEAHAMSPDA